MNRTEQMVNSITDGSVPSHFTNSNPIDHGERGKHNDQESTVKPVGDVTLQILSDEDGHSTAKPPLWRRIYEIMSWTPPSCRWNHENPPKFSMSLNVLFAFAGAFTVANLYYNHPILNILADDFGVSYEKVSQIPTLAQAGYAVGLLFLGPLGDLLKRRPFVLTLVFFTATFCIGLCVTKSLAVFSAIQFITGVTTVTPQLMMPLVGDLAPPKRRAAALSIVGSGLMLGILIARLLSGIVTQYTSWRNIYWLSVGLQYLIFILLWFFMPDYPSTNPGGLNYVKMLWSILVMLTKHPVLLQACLVSLCISATFTNFWTTLTFLLSSPPYNFSPVIVGLFALVGIASMCTGPIYARYIIDRFVPLFSVALGMGWCMLGVCVGTYTGLHTVAGPILQAWFNDFGMQTAQTANRSAIYRVEPKGRNRVNTAYMLFTFFGQLIGTSVGANLYAKGGWIASGSFSVGAVGVATIIVIARGPWEDGWVGWHGGWSIFKKSSETADGKREAEPDYLTELKKGVYEKGTDITDVEKGLPCQDHHQHRHGRDNQNEVNANDTGKALELLAAEDTTDALEDEGKSAKSDEDEITPVQGKS